MSDFKDILVELEKVRDIVFMTKSWKPVKANLFGRKLTVNEIRPLVLKSARVSQIVDKISKEKNVSKNELFAQVRAFLDEMGHKKNMTIIRWVGLALCKLLRQNYLGIMVDEDTITTAKHAMGTNPVIFVPSHRSYGDFILMSFLCYYYDIEIPSIAAGMDFKGMWGIGDILRDCGAFFIKRSFGGDALYRATFHEYITTLVANGESAIEFFIEGTRSRTGKSLVPKFGLLTAAVEQYFIGKVPDITIIPISITYERILEEKLFANELLGVPKPKESTRLLFKALKILNDNYGHVFVKFGTPISVREYCSAFMTGDPRVQINQLSIPLHNAELKPKLQGIVENLGHDIISAQNSGMEYTPIHKFAACFSASIMHREDIPVSYIMDGMAAIESVLNNSDSGDITDVSFSAVIYCINLHKEFIVYDKENETISLRKFSHAVHDTASATVKRYNLLPATVDKVFPVMLLQQYANSVCAKCCKVSILTSLAYIAQVDLIDKDNLMDNFMDLRSLFSIEFVSIATECSLEKDYLDAVSVLKKFGLLQENSKDSRTLIIKKGQPGSRNETREMVLIGIIYPFFQGYLMTIKECCKKGVDGTTKISMKKFIKEVQRAIESSMPEFAIHGYALSIDLVANAINSFVYMDAIEKVRISPVDFELSILPEKCNPVKEILDSYVTYLGGILEAHSKQFPEKPKKKCNL